MAQRVQVILVDDYDGKEMEKGEAVHVPLALDGTEWELDLRDENVEKLREAIAPFIANVTPTRQARKTRKSRTARSAAPASTPEVASTGDDLTLLSASERRAIRTWGKANGWPQLGDRGRLPADLLEAYNTEQPVAAAQ